MSAALAAAAAAHQKGENHVEINESTNTPVRTVRIERTERKKGRERERDRRDLQ